MRRNLSLALAGICCVLAGAIGVRLVGDRAQPTTVTPSMVAPQPVDTAAPPPAESPSKGRGVPIVDSPAPTVQRALEKPAMAEATPAPIPVAVATPPVAGHAAAVTPPAAQPIAAKVAIEKVTPEKPAVAAEAKPAAEKAPKVAIAKPADKSDDKTAAPAETAAAEPPIDHGVESAGF